MKLGGACGAYGGGERPYMVLIGKPEGESPLRRPRRRWEYNIKMDLQEEGCGSSWLRVETGGGHL